MFRRTLVLSVVALMLLANACTFDYVFFAFNVQCPYDDDGHPTRCYPRSRWNRVKCTVFASSPVELYAAFYSLELDLDEPPSEGDDARAVGFPRKLQISLTGTNAEGTRLFRFRPPAWKVNKATGRIERTVEVTEDLVVPPGGQLCLDIKTKGTNELVNGMPLGLLWEQMAAARPGS